MSPVPRIITLSSQFDGCIAVKWV